MPKRGTLYKTSRAPPNLQTAAVPVPEPSSSPRSVGKRLGSAGWAMTLIVIIAKGGAVAWSRIPRLWGGERGLFSLETKVSLRSPGELGVQVDLFCLPLVRAAGRPAKGLDLRTPSYRVRAWDSVGEEGTLAGKKWGWGWRGPTEFDGRVE